MDAAARSDAIEEDADPQYDASVRLRVPRGRRAEAWEMRVTQWTEIAEWYDRKQGDRGDLWHRALIDPCLVKVVGRVRGRRILDLGCGNGYLSRRFARAGARVTAVDASAPIVRLARTRERRRALGIEYHVADGARLDMLEDGAFDLVFSNMALMDIEDAAGAIREVARVLKTGGRFVASLSHPCFDNGSPSGWAIERVGLTTTVWRKIRRYREAFAEPVPWHGGPDRVFYTPGYHRPLSWYVRTLRDTGLLVASLEEPYPTRAFLRGSPQGPWIAEVPLHLVLEGVKVDRGRPARESPRRGLGDRSRRKAPQG